MKKTVVALIGSVVLTLACAARVRPQTDPAATSRESSLPAASAIQGLSAKSRGSTDTDHNRAAEVTIASGDLLQITLFGTDFSCGFGKSGCEVRVSASGNIVLPLIGSVKVAGLTVAQAEQVIAARLSQGGFYNNAQVTIIQKEFATQGISVLGEVQKPGIYPLLGPHTLLQAIAAAGGTTVKAGNDVMIVRKSESRHVNLSSSTSRTVPLMPGDTIVVSKAGIVYVVGDVHQPTGIVMDNSGLTVLQAVAMAQGTNPTASLNKAKLIRHTPKGRHEMPIPLRKILSNSAQDVALESGDILFIPSSRAKSTGRGLEGIVQAATGGLVYRTY